MFKKFSFILAVCFLVGGCASKVQVNLEKNFEKTLAVAMQELPCQSASVKSPFDPQEADFMCTGGRLEQLYLRINRRGEHVSQVTVHWKEYEQDSFFHEKDTHVKPFLDFVAKNFLSGNNGFVYDIFFADDSYARAKSDYAITMDLGEGEGQKGIKYVTRKLEILYR